MRGAGDGIFYGSIKRALTALILFRKHYIDMLTYMYMYTIGGVTGHKHCLRYNENQKEEDRREKFSLKIGRRFKYSRNE